MGRRPSRVGKRLPLAATRRGARSARISSSRASSAAIHGSASGSGRGQRGLLLARRCRRRADPVASRSRSAPALLAERAARQGPGAVALQQQPGQARAGGDAVAAGQVPAPRLEVGVDVERGLRRRDVEPGARRRCRPRPGRPWRAGRGWRRSRSESLAGSPKASAAACWIGAAGADQISLPMPTQLAAQPVAERALGQPGHADPPAAQGQALAERGGDDGPLRRHRRRAEHRRRGIVHQVAVDLVGDDDQVMLGGHRRRTPAPWPAGAARRSGCPAA